MNENQIQDVNPNADEIKNLEAQIAQIDVTKLDPSDNGKIKQDVTQETVSQPVQEQKVETPETPTEDPIKTELDRIQGETQGKSQKEKFEYKLKRQLAQAKEMGIDVGNLTGTRTQSDEETTEDDGEKPLTRREIEQMLQQRVVSPTKSAVEMAMEIENEAERELHLHYLENKVNPSLSEEEKFQTAKDMVTSIKLKNQVVLNNVRPQTQSHSSANSFQPAKPNNVDNVKLTEQEQLFFNDAKIRGIPLTKEEILAMRAK